MRRGLILIAVLASSTASADDLFVQASAAKSTVSSQQLALSRTFTSSPLGVEIGISHFNGDESNWTVGKVGMFGRLNKKLIASGTIEYGPGQIDGHDITYSKAMLGATWLISPQWTADFSDTYINIDESVGHVFSGAISRSFAGGLSLTLNAIGSGGGNIDTQQLGAKFRWQGKVSYLGGLYAGETRNPVVLNEFGSPVGAEALRVQQAYVGIDFPIGRFSLIAVFDHLRLEDAARREITLVLRVPLGSRKGAGR